MARFSFQPKTDTRTFGRLRARKNICTCATRSFLRLLFAVFPLASRLPAFQAFLDTLRAIQSLLAGWQVAVGFAFPVADELPATVDAGDNGQLGWVAAEH